MSTAVEVGPLTTILAGVAEGGGTSPRDTAAISKKADSDIKWRGMANMAEPGGKVAAAQTSVPRVLVSQRTRAGIGRLPRCARILPNPAFPG